MFAQTPPTTAEPAPETTAETGAAVKPGGVQGLVKDQGFIVWSMLLAGLLLVAAVIFMFFDRWRKRPTGETARDAAFSMSNFRQMYENGELTEAEYERIKLKMAAKMKEKLGVSPTPPPPPTPPPEAAAPAPDPPPA